MRSNSSRFECPSWKLLHFVIQASTRRSLEQNNSNFTKPKIEIVVWYCTCAVSKLCRREGDSPKLHWKYRNPKGANKIKEIVWRRISTALPRYTNFTIEQHCTTAVVTSKTQYFTSADAREWLWTAREHSKLLQEQRSSYTDCISSEHSKRMQAWMSTYLNKINGQYSYHFLNQSPLLSLHQDRRSPVAFIIANQNHNRL